MNDLVGAWRLTSAQFAFDDGDTVDLYGPGPNGRVLFTAEGWMMVLITSGGTASADAAQNPGMVIAYSGRYHIEAGSFITAVDVSSVPPWLGKEQRREYEVNGGQLSITLGMRALPAHPERPGRGTLKWNRE